jgi:hypothetical protein
MWRKWIAALVVLGALLTWARPARWRRKNLTAPTGLMLILWCKSDGSLLVTETVVFPLCWRAVHLRLSRTADRPKPMV